eukprot:TRINITY_DN7616_c0_g1_i1.p1 TRINITY_DN7616_c0_g1~~TRINITY_DN7616_c0_g1_i1.p1  ORF type:complete len:923 (+),score=238.49 TRINITY_DN7616_c0_g1_i1:2870-5638(+)
MLKQIKRNGILSWSKFSSQESLLACGTIASALSGDFDPSGTLDILSLDLTQDNQDMNVVRSVTTEEKMHTLCWGSSNASNPYGMIAAGLDNGVINIWNAKSLIDGDQIDPLLAEKHKGPVKGLSFNPFSPNLLASGGTNGEIFVWDISDNITPYTAGSQNPAGDSAITCCAWNKQTKPILATSSRNGVAVIWDFRKRRAVYHFNDQEHSIRYSSVAWSPESPTTIVCASDDDKYPVIQVWDLTRAHAPAMTLEGHSAGVLSVSWCDIDKNLLLSSGKDNRTICWDIKTGNMLCEVENTNEWNFDVQWSPTIPSVISTCSHDGFIKIKSLQDFSFNDFGKDKPLPRPPSWLTPTVGASFGFGGKIISFGKDSTDIKISLLPVDEELVHRSEKLEEVLKEGNFFEYCTEKQSQSQNGNEESVWEFLSVLSHDDRRNTLLTHLGFKPEDIKNEIAKHIDSFKNEESEEVLIDNVPAEETTEPGTDALFSNDSESGEFDIGFKEDLKPVKIRDVSPISFSNYDETETIITRALLVGDYEKAVECCILADRMADALVIASNASKELLIATRERYLSSKEDPFHKMVSLFVDHNFEDLVVRTDLDYWKELLAIGCCYEQEEEFTNICNIVGDRLFEERNDNLSAVICYICAGNVEKAAKIWEQEDTATLDSIERIVIWGAITDQAEPNNFLKSQYINYAELLANNGKLESALLYLETLDEGKELQDRIEHNLGKKSTKVSTKISTNRPPMPTGSNRRVVPTGSHGLPMPVGSNRPPTSVVPITNPVRTNHGLVPTVSPPVVTPPVRGSPTGNISPIVRPPTIRTVDRAPSTNPVVRPPINTVARPPTVNPVVRPPTISGNSQVVTAPPTIRTLPRNIVAPPIKSVGVSTLPPSVIPHSVPSATRKPAATSEPLAPPPMGGKAPRSKRN